MLKSVWLAILLTFALMSGSSELSAFRATAPVSDVKDWRLVAVTFHNKGAQVEKIAALESRDGASYVVKEGDLVGPENAVILEITDKWILIERAVKFPNGAFMPETGTIHLYLKEQPETDPPV